MSELQSEIQQAQMRWNARQRGNSAVKSMWQDVSWKFFSGDSKLHELGIKSCVQMNAFDAVCTLIQIGDYGVEFAEDAPPYGREVAGLRIIQLAAQAPYDHVLQELFIMGAFDRFLIAASSTPELISLPDWAAERLLGVLSAMIMIEGGEYNIGNPNDDALEEESGPITAFVESYEIGAYPVTQALYQSVMQDNPSVFFGSGRPVENVSWYDAITFCNALSEKANLQQAYQVGTGDSPYVKWNSQANGYRLLTEAEWEIAARAGAQYLHSGSNTIREVGWSFDDHLKETCSVGLRRPNQWGVYDLSGLVFEWVFDWFAPYPTSIPFGHFGPSEGFHRCRRGGSIKSQAEMCQVWARSDRRPMYRHESTGFRVARNVY